MGEPVDLRLYCPVYLRAPVAVDIDPQGRDAGEVSRALGVDEVVAAAALDYERVGLDPFVHLGERVPDVLAVEPYEPLCLFFHLCLPRRADDQLIACQYAAAFIRREPFSVCLAGLLQGPSRRKALAAFKRRGGAYALQRAQEVHEATVPHLDYLRFNRALFKPGLMERPFYFARLPELHPMIAGVALFQFVERP